MKFKSITYKWVFNFIGIVSIILILTNFVVFTTVSQYFNNYAKESVKLNSNNLNNLINSKIKENPDNLTEKIKNLIENFTGYDSITVVGFNLNGEIFANSSKLNINENLNFLTDHLTKSFKEAGFKKFKLKDKKTTVLAYFVKLPIVNDKISTIVYITSLKKIKLIILNIMVVTAILSFLILILIVISGIFFIKYFVTPVREINLAIKEIAKGNLKYKIIKNYHYEVKELCSSINFMAKEINASETLKNEFISSISHELRTPLTAIRGWSETILNTKEKNEEILSKGMSIISKEVLRLSEMVEELLDFSKIQNGQFVLKKDKMDILAELEEAVLIYSDIALKEGKNLVYNEQKTVPIIYGDKNRIRQVFINIIDNAIKYSQAGDSITIYTEVLEKKVKIFIKDTGCGVSKKDIPHITEKFYKANSTKKGSGIGLSVVKEIVKKHDGKINFESSPKKGTTVILEFNLYLKN